MGIGVTLILALIVYVFCLYQNTLKGLSEKQTELLRKLFEDLTRVATIAALIIVAFGFILSFWQAKLIEFQIFSSNSTSIIELGEKSLWYNNYGDHTAYNILKKLAKKSESQLKDEIKQKIKYVRDEYRFANRINKYVQDNGVICKQHIKPCEPEPFDGYDANNVLNVHLNFPWRTTRALAAYYLRNFDKANNNGIRIENVLEKLIETMRQNLPY